MSWYRVVFSKEEISRGEAIRLDEDFSRVFLGFGSPRDAGMFGGVMDRQYFFSPGAVRIAEHVIRARRAEECSAPKRSEVRIIFAHPDVEAIPFATEDNGGTGEAGN